METTAVWTLFAETGLPEAYILFCYLKGGERQGEERTA